jgi:hypothetical protein
MAKARMDTLHPLGAVNVLTRLNGVALHCIAGTLEAAIHEFTDQPRIPRLLVMASGAEVAHQTPAKTFRPTVMEVRCACQGARSGPGPGGVSTMVTSPARIALFAAGRQPVQAV